MTKEYFFGRKPSPLDIRDYNLASFLPPRLPDTGVTSSDWSYDLESLDQGTHPHCIGFSIANFGINEPVITYYTNDDGHRFYYEAKEFDGEPGEENGSTIRSAAKVMRKYGQINGYAFTTDMDSIKWWVLNKGPLVIGTLWTCSMLEPDENFIIKPDSNIVGGHAYIINSYNENGYFGIQNSWGKDWGCNGKAYIHENDFRRIFIRGGEAIAAIELDGHIEKPNEKLTLCQKFKRFFKNLFSEKEIGGFYDTNI